MRAAQWLAVALLLLPCAAWANDQAYQAKYTISMEFGDEFYKLLAAQSEPGAELDSESLEMQPVGGNLFFDRQHLRLDLNALGGVMSTIVNTQSQTMLMVDHTSRIAWKSDLAAFAQRYAAAGLPVMNMEEVFLHWEDVLLQLKQLPGLKYKDLVWKTIDGARCRGISFSGRIEDVLISGKVQLLPELKPLGDLRGPWRGEYWINEECGIPVTMQTQMFGVTWSWAVTELKPWDVNVVVFEVPRGYRLKPLDLAAPFAER